MQDVEEQRFQEFRVLAHALEVEALETRERDRVLGIVEEESELATTGPFGEAAPYGVPERVLQHCYGAQRRVDRIPVFDLLEEGGLGGRGEPARLLPRDEHF